MSGDTKLSCAARNSEDAIAWAKENGLVVLFPEANQLFLDIDRAADRKEFRQNRDLIEEAYGIESVDEAFSRGGNSHFTVTLGRNVTPLERIALQAVLGSDRRREAHSLRRLLEGEENPTIFFRKP